MPEEDKNQWLRDTHKEYNLDHDEEYRHWSAADKEQYIKSLLIERAINTLKKHDMSRLLGSCIRGWTFQAMANEKAVQMFTADLAQAKEDQRDQIMASITKSKRIAHSLAVLRRISAKDQCLRSEEYFDWARDEEISAKRKLAQEKHTLVLNSARELGINAINFLQVAKNKDWDKLFTMLKSGWETEPCAADELTPEKILLWLSEKPRIFKSIDTFNMELQQVGRSMRRAAIVARAYDLTSDLAQHIKEYDANQQNAFIADYKKLWHSRLDYTQEHDPEIEAPAYALALSLLHKSPGSFKNGAVTFELVQATEESQHRMQLLAKITKDILENEEGMKKMLAYIENMDRPATPASRTSTPSNSGSVTPASKTVTSPIPETTPCPYPQSSPTSEIGVMSTRPSPTLPTPVPMRSATPVTIMRTTTPVPKAMAALPPANAVRIVGNKVQVQVKNYN